MWESRNGLSNPLSKDVFLYQMDRACMLQEYHGARLWRQRQPAPPLEFPGEHGILSGIYAQVREEE